MTKRKELPQYQCFTIVGALKIRKLGVTSEIGPGELLLVPWNSDYNSIILTKEYVQRYKPQVGGYYATYKDGSIGYAEAKMFESNFNKLIEV